MAHGMVLFGGLGVLAGTLARLLVGRLRRGARVPSPWCELALGVLWAISGGWWAGGWLPGAWLPLVLGLAWLGVAAGAVDLSCRRLPDALTLPALPAALALVVPLGPVALGRAVGGAAVLFGAHLVVRLAAPASLGAGDVKLAAALGAVLGAVSWPALAVGVALAATVTGLLAGCALVAGRPGRAAALPHGPAMLAAGWTVVVAGGLDAGDAAAWVA